MFKLLSANLSRLKKEKVFWAVILFMFGLGLFFVLSSYNETFRYNSSISLDKKLFEYSLVIGCCTAVFCSIFTGTEYSNGTIRNKLIVGHTRSAVYLANWIISAAAAIVMMLAFLIPYCLTGYFYLMLLR